MSWRIAAALCAVAALWLTVPAASPLPAATAEAAECNGDECQTVPPAPEDPTPATAVVEGPQNPPVRFPKQGRRHRGKKHQHKHRHPRDGHRRGHG